MLGHLRTALHAIADFFGEAFCLSHHATGRLQQTAVGRFQPVSARRRLGTRRPGDLQHPPFHAAAPIAQLRAGSPRQFGDLAHATRQYSDPITQQAAVGRVMDVALSHRGVDPHLAPLHHLLRQRDLHHSVVYLFHYERSERNSPAAHGFGISHLAGADTGEVPIYQIGPHFTLQNRVAPIANVLQDQQAQHDFGGVTWSAMAAAVGIALRQGFVDC